MFVQTEEKSAVNSSVPNLNSELSVTSVSLNANSQKLIKQTVNNIGNADMNYGIKASSTSTNYYVQIASMDNNNSYGSLTTGNTKDIYLVVSNFSNQNITINFELDKGYSTITYDTANYLKNSNISNTDKFIVTESIPYSNTSLYNRYGDLNADGKIDENDLTMIKTGGYEYSDSITDQGKNNELYSTPAIDYQLLVYYFQNLTREEVKSKIKSNLEKMGTEIKTGVLQGDINLDGEIDIFDNGDVKNYLEKNTTLTDDQKLAGDNNHNGVIDIGDLFYYQPHILEKPSEEFSEELAKAYDLIGTRSTIGGESTNTKLNYTILNNYVNSDLYTKKTIPTLMADKTEIDLPINIDVPSPTSFTSVETNEVGLYKADDDYGTSYYFRGASTKNYVSFAEKIWRIVRINGDGSIRVVLEDAAKDSSGNEIKTKFNTNVNDNAYIGYMYGTPGSTTYDATHENKNDSTIKIAVDKWYEDNLKTNYANYLSDTLFCGDKTLAESGIGSGNTAKGYGTNITYYSSTERLMYSSGTTAISTSTPTLKCAEKANDNYSRYTTSKSILPNGKETNGDLKYPIGLLTADEVAYAGAYKLGQTNEKYYLYNSSITSFWWLSFPYVYYGSNAYAWGVDGSYGPIHYSNINYSNAFRPSINLKADLLINGGDGTGSNPYTVKLS